MTKIALDKDWIEFQNTLLIHEINIIKIEIDLIKQNLDRFMQEYLSKVAVYIKYSGLLQGVEKQIGPTDLYKIAYDHELKSLYRKLAKSLHPDMGNNNSLFLELSEAYESKNLEAMVRIECELERSQDFSDLDSMLKEYTRFEHIRDNIKNSASYKLQQKALFAKLEGRDLIDEIRVKFLAELV